MGAVALLWTLATGVRGASRPGGSAEVLEVLETTREAVDPGVFDFFSHSASSFLKPVDDASKISSPFSPRWKYSKDSDDFHRGIDYFGELGEGIYAMATGSVHQVHTEEGGTFSGGGNVVVLKHSLSPPAGTTFHDRAVTQVFSYYMHLDTIDAAMVEDAEVTAGQVVGTMGQSGDTKFTHLHFETRLQGYCSLQWQVKNNREPNPSSSCNTGFDPHVHPYLFVGGARGGSRTLVRVEPLDESYAYAVRYCGNRSALDMDGVRTDFGTVMFNTREGMNADTMESLDNLAQITSWMNLRPLDFVSASTEACYELHFPTRPSFVEVRDIYGETITAQTAMPHAISGEAEDATNETTTVGQVALDGTPQRGKVGDETENETTTVAQGQDALDGKWQWDEVENEIDNQTTTVTSTQSQDSHDNAASSAYALSASIVRPAQISFLVLVSGLS